MGRAVDESAASSGVTGRRQRRWVAVNALIEVFNLAVVRGIIPAFAVKGGFALEFRFRNIARTSRDVDIVIPIEADDMLDAIIEVLRLQWSGFAFRIKGEPERREHSFRFEVNTDYQNRAWSTFELELVFAPVASIDIVEPLDLAAFGLLSSAGIPCMTIPEQIAQKLHAVSDPTENRPRDLLDIYLCASQIELDHDEVRTACHDVFAQRAAHPWPPNITIRDEWPATLNELIQAGELAIGATDVIAGVNALIGNLIGITMAENFRYHFLVLSARQNVPTVLESAIDNDNGLEIFNRMTQQEGWRLSQLIQYPLGGTRAMLAVLEKPVEPAPS